MSLMKALLALALLGVARGWCVVDGNCRRNQYCSGFRCRNKGGVGKSCWSRNACHNSLVCFRSKCFQRRHNGYDTGCRGTHTLGLNPRDNCDYSMCHSGRGFCGVCTGRRRHAFQSLRNGQRCQSNAMCQSRNCLGFNSLGGACAGFCRPTVRDGQRVPGCTGLNRGCYATACVSGKGQCGICGLAPRGFSCHGHSDCQRGFYCTNRRRRLAPTCGGTCNAKLADGSRINCIPQPWKKCTYNGCRSGRGVCNRCGGPNKFGQRCKEDADCAQGLYCHGRNWLGNRDCHEGRCKLRKSDGSRMDSSHGAIQCAVGAYVCGVCGKPGSWIFSYMAKCQRDRQCAPGFCCRNNMPFFPCSGNCVKASPGTCPGFFDKIVLGIQNGVKSIVNWANDVGKCLGNNQKKIRSKASDVRAPLFKCKFELDLSTVTFVMTCGTNIVRRLGELDEAEHPDVHMEVHRPRLLTLEKNVGDPNGVAGAVAPRDLLFGRPLTFGPWTYAVPCFSSGQSTNSSNAPPGTPFKNTQSTSYSCMAGAAVAMKAEIRIDPEFTFSVDVSTKTLSFSASLTLSGKVALVALASGLCSYTFEQATDPSANLPTFACYGPYCIAIFWQYILTVALKGEIKARAKFESHVDYTFKVGGRIDIDPKMRRQRMNLTRSFTPNQTWNFELSGQSSARISGTIGPLVSVLVTPGLWASLYPTVTLEASAAGSAVLSMGNGLSKSILPDPTFACKNADNSSWGNATVTVKNKTVGVPGSQACITAAVSAKGAFEASVMGLPKLDFDSSSAANSSGGVTNSICSIVKQFATASTRVLDDVACLISPKTGKTSGTSKLKQMAKQTADATCKAFKVMKEGIFVTKQEIFCHDVWKKSSSKVCSVRKEVGCPVRTGTVGPACAGCEAPRPRPLPDLISSDNFHWRIMKRKIKCQNVKQHLNQGRRINEALCAAMVENDIFCGSYMVYGRGPNTSTVCECVFAGAQCIEVSAPLGWRSGLYMRYYKGKQQPAPTKKFATNDDFKSLVQSNSIVFVCGLIGLALANIACGIAVFRCRRSKYQTRAIPYTDLKEPTE